MNGWRDWLAGTRTDPMPIELPPPADQEARRRTADREPRLVAPPAPRTPLPRLVARVAVGSMGLALAAGVVVGRLTTAQAAGAAPETVPVDVRIRGAVHLDRSAGAGILEPAGLLADAAAIREQLLATGIPERVSVERSVARRNPGGRRGKTGGGAPRLGAPAALAGDGTVLGPATAADFALAGAADLVLIRGADRGHADLERRAVLAGRLAAALSRRPELDRLVSEVDVSGGPYRVQVILRSPALPILLTERGFLEAWSASPGSCRIWSTVGRGSRGWTPGFPTGCSSAPSRRRSSTSPRPRLRRTGGMTRPADLLCGMTSDPIRCAPCSPRPRGSRRSGGGHGARSARGRAGRVAEFRPARRGRPAGRGHGRRPSRGRGGRTDRRRRGRIGLRLGGSHTRRSINSSGAVSILTPRNRIAESDVYRAVMAAVPRDGGTAWLRPPFELLHALPQEFWVDDLDSTDNPTGWTGEKIESHVHLVSCPRDTLHRIEEAVNAAGIRIERLVAAPLAAGYGVLTGEERQRVSCSSTSEP